MATLRTLRRLASLVVLGALMAVAVVRGASIPPASSLKPAASSPTTSGVPERAPVRSGVEPSAARPLPSPASELPSAPLHGPPATTTTTTTAAPPTSPPTARVEEASPVTGDPDRYHSGCDGPVWAPAFAALGVTPLDLDVRGCEVVPSYSLARGEGGNACGLFAPGERIATVDRRTMDGGCHPRPLVVLVHELGHAWHTLSADRDAWARTLGVESVANCFAAVALDIQLRGCPAEVRAEVAAQMALG